MKFAHNRCIGYIMLFFIPVISCTNRAPTQADIQSIGLKKGNVVSCGTGDEQFGDVEFSNSCGDAVKQDFNLALSLLHSFEYNEAEKQFAKIIDINSECAMAYWGVAMSNFHPLWSPPNKAELEKGSKAIAIASSISNKSKIETGYINALKIFYKNASSVNHLERVNDYKNAMEKLYEDNPDNNEVAIFYALALDASANLSDTLFTAQKKAGNILMGLYKKYPKHPGIIHYIIHTYDYPGLAVMALPAAKKYALIAPASAHAQHMPSHIFTRLGMWDDCIYSNLASVASAQCYASALGMNGHWDEELHGLDYLMYAYLQKGDHVQALEQLNYLRSIDVVNPVNFKVAYAFSAMPARYALENKNWKEAAQLQLPAITIDWNQYPWQKAIFHFTRALGLVHLNKKEELKIEIDSLKNIYARLQNDKDNYSATQVQIQLGAVTAWSEFINGNNVIALQQMQAVADLEDHTQKHPVTPGEVLPARELFADMLFQMNKTNDALIAYEADLLKHPNRFNALYGAAVSSELLGNNEKAAKYYSQLLQVSQGTNSNRLELKEATRFMSHYKTQL